MKIQEWYGILYSENIWGGLRMVPSLSVVFSVVTLLLSLALPVVLAIWFCRRYHASAAAVLLGALTFFVFQLVIRIPLMQILSPIYPGDPLKNPITGWRLFVYSIYLSGTAALFEEGGRVIIYKLFLKKRKDWNDAAAFGIGHGGFEAISIVGIMYINNLVLMFLINLGLINTAGGSQEALTQAVQALTGTEPVLFLLAGIERVFAITLHIGFSLLVVYGLVSKRKIFVFYSFLAHFLLNFPLAFVKDMAGGVYIALVYVGAMAACSLYWITKISPDMFQRMQKGEVQEVR
jgi:uncharacterized membrane protein YhfC